MKSYIQTADSKEDLLSFLLQIKQEANCNLSKISVSEMKDWSLERGVLSHTSKGFFQVLGAQNRVLDKEQIILYQPQSAITGLIYCRNQRGLYFLLQARVEPGNTNFVQYGPTIQSTPANYLQHHGGAKTHYSQMFLSYSQQSQPTATSYQFDLGRRYFQKSKSHTYLQSQELFATEETMIWASWSAICQLLAKDNIINADLRSLFSVFDWHVVGITKENSTIDVISEENYLFQRLHTKHNTNWQIKPLTSLSSYSITKNGISANTKDMPTLQYYSFSANFREKDFWTQPLLSTTRKGLVVLLMRQRKQTKEFLVTLTTELGISGGVTLQPTIALYPEEASEEMCYQSLKNIQPSTLCYEFTQCDEGGRFINHEHHYKLYKTTDYIEPQPDQYWISEAALKNILSTSCIASFQLRVMSSILLYEGT